MYVLFLLILVIVKVTRFQFHNRPDRGRLLRLRNGKGIRSPVDVRNLGPGKEVTVSRSDVRDEDCRVVVEETEEYTGRVFLVTSIESGWTHYVRFDKVEF